MSDDLSLLSLLVRIHRQHVREIWSTFFSSIEEPLKIIGFFLLIIIGFRCPNRIYNTWYGPFSMNISQFKDQLRINYEPIDSYTNILLFFSVSRPEYIQLELGDKLVPSHPGATVIISEDNMFYGKTSYKFHTILNVCIPELNETFFVKYLADEDSQYKIRFPYRFDAFHMNTFQCIINQLEISSELFNLWFEQSIHIEMIQQIYDDNPRYFNERVIKQCGIVLAYLLRPLNEYPTVSNSKEYQGGRLTARILDASSLYTTYGSHAALILLIGIGISYLISILLALKSNLKASHYQCPSSLKEHMDKMNISSLQQFDRLLFEANYENNYQDRLFIILDKYLIVTKIDLNETSAEILQNFLNQLPLTIIMMDKIIEVQVNGIIYESDHVDQIIPFPANVKTINYNPAPWLHKRLIALSDRYRDNWEINKEMYAEREKRQQLLQSVIEEETQYQQTLYRNRFSRLVSSTIPASPQFIAEVRLAGWKVVTNNLHGITCSVCLDDLRFNQFYNEWPCPAKHTFHYDCMINVLRSTNKCPLCRHPVESTRIFNLEPLMYRIAARWMPYQRGR